MLPSKQDDINGSGERVCPRLLRMNTYKRHRFPPDVISCAVWLHCRSNLSHRDIEDLLAERGVIVSRESIGFWCIKLLIGRDAPSGIFGVRVKTL
ncbi:MAG: hypothetical protein ACI87W_000651 [Halieaceae bacterium]|jgi:hypothetical protein